MVSTVELVSDRAPSVDLTVYRKQVYNFLKTATIKYQPLALALNDLVLRKGGIVDESDPQSWKYYKNAIGEYHPTDTPMYISSLDDKSKILFSKETLKDSPRTLEAYSVGNDYYDSLCSLYPDQTDLIKGIRYPIKDWKDLYDADDLAYISGDESLFEQCERDTLIAQMVKVLKFIDSRWNFTNCNNEPLFPWVFWGQIWQILTAALFAQRFENIRSENTHSWHVWQYITSQGLSDYSDLLTFSQSMFLYRNLNYLNLNRGKQSNLVILADNLLSEWSLSLYGRSVIQRTDKGFNECLLYPDLIAKVIPTKNASDLPIPLTSVENMIYKLITVGDEIPADQYPPLENAQRQERLLSDTSVNTYPTKVVEIAPVDRNKKYTEQFSTYLYDSLIYAIAKGHYAPVVEIPSKISQVVIQLSAKDCLLLFNYCMLRSVDRTPDLIPTVHKSALALKPGPVKLREWYIDQGIRVNIHGYLNVADYTSNYFQMDYNRNQPVEFSRALLKGFESLVHQASMQRLNADVRTGQMMRLITKNLLIIGDVDVHLADETTYTDWLKARPDLYSQIIAPIEANAKIAKNVYATLAANIVDTLIPVIPEFNRYGDFEITDNSYQRIKQLFIQLTSYNITFVDDNTTSPTYLFLPHFSSSIWSESDEGEIFYTNYFGRLRLAEKMSDQVCEVIFDKVVSMDHDTMDDPNFRVVSLSAKGSKLGPETLGDVVYVDTGYRSALSEGSQGNEIHSLPVIAPCMDLDLSDVVNP